MGLSFVGAKRKARLQRQWVRLSFGRSAVPALGSIPAIAASSVHVGLMWSTLIVCTVSKLSE